MTYATQQDLIDRFSEAELIQLSDHANAGTIDISVVGTALADADDEINGYVGQQYPLPLVTVPALLVRLAADIARYRLYADGVQDTVRNRYLDAVALLRGIANGSLSLGVASTGPADTGEAVMTTPADIRSWTRSSNGGIR